jgi:alkylation response protein AidB-like acyl-CoA dehydrogenase
MTATALRATEDLAAEPPGIDALLESARAMAPLLRGRAQQTEQDRMVSADVIDLCRTAGFFRLLQPRRFGGLEYRFSDFVQLAIELGRADGSTAWATSIAILHNWLVGLYPLEAQREVWANPDALVTGSYAPSGKCEAAEGGYMLSGEWSFASNCDHSEWFVVAAFLPRGEAGGPPVSAWFLVPRSVCWIKDTWFSMGMSGTGSKTVVVDTPVFVPHHRALTVAAMNSGAAPGSEANTNPLYRLTFTGSAPFTLCAVPLGVAIGAVESFIELARTKMASQPGSPPVPMGQLPSVQLAIGEASAIVDSVRLLLEHDAGEIDTLHEAGTTLDVPGRIRHRRDHGFAAKECARAVTLLFEAMGANGGALNSPIQRAWRDVNIVARHMSLSWPTTGAMYGQLMTGQKVAGTY